MTSWSYARLNDNATLIVIGTPASVTTTTERTNLLGDISAKGIETSFKVLTVLKGDLKTDSFVLHHFALADLKDIKAINAGMGLISFEPRSYKSYLIFLQRESDGRYLAVSGQSDPIFSVKRLTDNAPPDAFGIPPNAKSF